MSNVRKDNLIDIFKDKFSKNSKDDNIPDEFKGKDIESLVKKALSELESDTKMKSIRLTPGSMSKTDSDMNKRTDTKIGGIPYWPNDMEYPTCDGKPMIMLGQLNFSKLPKLEGYPTSGIMQIFTAGVEYEDIGKGRTKVIYHKDAVSIDKMLKDVPRSTINPDPEYDKYFPIEGVYYPSASIEEWGINPSNEEWGDMITDYLNKYFNTSYLHWYDFPNRVSRIVWDNIDKGYWGCRIGGHPYFTQNDMREGVATEMLLLQLDSEAGMMWGDCGIANFFTSKEALRNLDFDKKVLFTWDCL
jgi:uncharacterized protein YwqG